jgi:hypothetical protein
MIEPPSPEEVERIIRRAKLWRRFKFAVLIAALALGLGWCVAARMSTVPPIPAEKE